jgi:hypothetical protein
LYFCMIVCMRSQYALTDLGKDEDENLKELEQVNNKRSAPRSKEQMRAIAKNAVNRIRMPALAKTRLPKVKQEKVTNTL